MSSVIPSQVTPPAGERPSHFLRHIVEHDLARLASADGRLEGHIRTRFPPEPNGYLHLGHAKSIWLNFGLAQDYRGVCHLRFDDTNPAKEEQEYVDAIIDAVRWLGYDWASRPFERQGNRPVADHLYFASDYFEKLYEYAVYLIETGHAYVDSQSAEEMRASRGTLTEPGRDSPWRGRSVLENRRLFEQMREGVFEDGAHVLRARISMAAPNINLRDPVLYRIRRAHHHRTKDAWCIYPMYDYTHCISDALECITHSICTLEFEDHRPLYDWVLERIVPVLRPKAFGAAVDKVGSLREKGIEAQKEFAVRCFNARDKLDDSAPERAMADLFKKWEHDIDAVPSNLSQFFSLLENDIRQFSPLLAHALDVDGNDPFELPHQYEFARLNVSYIITSKRKLLQLVTEKKVSGWDDPRMPTLVGLRRRGYTPQSIRLLCERSGVSKANSLLDYALLEAALRDDLEGRAPRAAAVLRPLKLVLDNFPEGGVEVCTAPVHPHQETMGRREFNLTRELWIEADDFTETPAKGYFRLFPGNRVRLRYGYVIECTGCDKDAQGNVVAVHATVLMDTRSGTPGADSVKVKGNIHWIDCATAVRAEIRLYDRLFSLPVPENAEGGFLEALNPGSCEVVQGFVESGVRGTPSETHFQFERHGYFVTDRIDSRPDALVFNRVATLKDSWDKPNR